MQPLKNKEIIISNPDERGEIIWPYCITLCKDWWIRCVDPALVRKKTPERTSDEK